MTELARLKDNIAQDLLDIETMFRPGVKLTLLARRPGEPEQDVIVSGDDLAEVAAMLRRRQAEETGPAALDNGRLFPIAELSNLKPAKEQACGVPAIVLWIPWALLAPHEAQAKANHGQSLERLAQRGGLTADEAVAVIEGRPWHRMSRAESNARLMELMAR